MMRIIDCFPYFNEKELLELRINLLHDKVDKFIICDANKTHKGTSKPFTCKNTLQKLGLLSDKIQVIEVNLPSYDEESDSWVRERAQRNAAAEFIQDGDVCIVSDCDEIISPNFVEYYVRVAQNHPQNILRIPLAFLMGRGDLRTYDESGNPVLWNAPYLCLKSHLEKYTLSDIRESHALSTHHLDYPDIFTCDNGIIEDAGWHFSWMGDESRIKTKSESFLHWDEISLKEDYLPKENSTDCLGRQNHILKKYPINLLPEKVFELSNVTQFLFQSTEKNKENILNEVGQNNYFNWGGHKEFSQWLVNYLKPEVTVDLGVDFGYSTFCFGLPKIGKVYGIDCFEGDGWAGFRNTYEYVLHKKNELELDNVTLIRGYFDDVVQTWDKKINILHIDGFHSYESVKNDFEKWSSFIDDDGVILLHDTMVDNSNFDFGVRKFFNEINLPKTNFSNSNGLGIVSKNKNLIEKIKSQFPNLIYEFNNEKNTHDKKTLLSILEENPFLITDKNSVCYKKYPERWTWMQYHSYVENFYEEAFERFKEKSNINICEIGIDIGGSIALWSKYFENGNVIGIDINSIRLDEQYKEENFNNVKYYINDAYDKEFIKSLPLFDIIIDDGPHTFGTMLKFIQNYVDKLNPGGLMVIEDIPDESWINYFKILTPKNLKTTVIDLRQIDNRYDSLMFAIEKV